MKRTIKLVTAPNDLPLNLHSFLVDQCQIKFSKQTCEDPACDCVLEVYKGELPKDYHKDTQQELEGLIRNSETMYMYVNETTLID